MILFEEAGDAVDWLFIGADIVDCGNIVVTGELVTGKVVGKVVGSLVVELGKGGFPDGDVVQPVIISAIIRTIPINKQDLVFIMGLSMGEG